MNYIVSTFFDEEDWNKFGLNWVRNAKSASLDAIIIGKDLPEDAIAKIAELNFLYFLLYFLRYFLRFFLLYFLHDHQI
jgi:hypothetical protein